VQFRATRRDFTSPIAEREFRTAVLVYGDDVAVGRSFQIVGFGTFWSGHVTSHPHDKFLVYSGQEVLRTGIHETLSMIMLDVFGTRNTLDHHGIVLGIGRGTQEGSNFPIYASRVLLWRIRGEGEDLSAPLANEQIDKLRSYCQYVSPSEFEKSDPSIERDHFIIERRQAIRRFIERGQSAQNSGDRIFVRE
jgi:hypothetical protein